MIRFKGTPGPWYYESNSRAIGPLIQDDDDQCFHMIEHVAYVEYQLNEDIQHSNAHLIAAAPELLEALIKCADALEEVSYQAWCGEIIDETRAAIAKATGETK